MKMAVIATGVFLTLGLCSCGKVQDKMLDINPEHVTRQFFESWQAEDWRALYALSHPSFVQKLRLQKLNPYQQKMSDIELFTSEFRRVSKLNPGKALVRYEIVSISPYNPGDTTLWVDARVNGKSRRIPLTLEGLSLKVDLTRIE